MDLLSLVAKLSLDSSEYEKGLGDAEAKGSTFGSGLKKAAVAGAAAVAAVGTAAIAAGTSLAKGVGDVAAYGDNIDKMSQKMGISAQAYQEWDAIMQHSGTSIDSMSRGMQTLQKNAINSADKFEKLGISQEQLASMSTEDLFSATITGLQNMGEGAERTALASELLGGSAKELGALLNTSAEDTQAMRDRVHELGGVMSDDAVKAAAAYQDALQDMQTGFDGLKRNLVAEFLPSVTTVMDGLTNIFSGNTEEGLGKISEGIDTLVTNLSEKLPLVIEVGAKILESLATAIIDNLPTLIKAAVSIITELATGLIENLPKIIEAAVTLVMTLAQGLIDALPELIPAIVETITTIAEMLTQPDTLVQLIMAAVQIMIALAEGLIQAIPILIEAAPQIIDNLVMAIIELLPQLIDAGIQLVESLVKGIKSIFNAVKTTGKDLIDKLIDGITSMFTKIKDKGKELVDKVKEGFKEKVEQAKEWGKDLIQNFIDGILAKWEALKENVKNVAQTVKDFLGFSEPKLGPLSNFHTYAPDMMELFAKGIDQNLPLVETSMNRMGNMVNGNMQFSTEGVNRGATYNGGITINVYQREGENDTEFARRIADIINSDVQRKRAVYA